MNTIAESYIALAERVAEHLPLPRVSTLHMPTATSPTSKDAEFAVLELEDGSCGFTYVWLGDTLEDMRRSTWAEQIRGQDLLTLIREYASLNSVHRALGMAALNALSQHLFGRAGWQPGATGDSLGQIDPQAGEHIGMVGLFPPLLAPIVESGAKLTVLELKAELAGKQDGYRVTLKPAELERCSKVVSTSTVLLNDTLDAVLHACRNARLIVLIGPTAGYLPDPLFKRGISSVGGAQVVDREAFLAAFHAGQSWGKYTRKYVIHSNAYPGLDTLLKQAEKV